MASLKWKVSDKDSVVLHSSFSLNTINGVFHFKETNTRPGFGSVNLRDTEIEEKVGEHVQHARLERECVCVCVCLPVVSVFEVVYNGGADAGHAPLAVVPSSCDDRELRSAQTLLTFYTERGQRRTKAHEERM